MSYVCAYSSVQLDKSCIEKELTPTRMDESQQQQQQQFVSASVPRLAWSPTTACVSALSNLLATNLVTAAQPASARS